MSGVTFTLHNCTDIWTLTPYFERIQMKRMHEGIVKVGVMAKQGKARHQLAWARKKKKKVLWKKSLFGELVFTDGLLFNACFCGQRRYEPFIHSCKQKGRKYCFLSILLQVGLSSAWAESHSQCTAATERGALLLAASRKKKERIGICRRKKQLAWY